MTLRRALAALILCAPFQAAAEVTIDIAYLRLQVERPPVLSDLDPVPEDEGLSGAELGIADLATTGRFLGHVYALSVHDVPAGGDLDAAAAAALAATDLVLLDMPAAQMGRIADMAPGALFLNISAPDVGLRQDDCRANLLHALPSHAMRSDALMQYLTVRRWTDVALLTGPFEVDAAWAEALRASAAKFGLRLRDDIPWEFDGDLGRTARAEIPLLTQGLRDHDVLIVADEVGDFGRYVLFNTWEPRPVAGSEGIVPEAWGPVMEDWGASQLQGRFTDLSGRAMRPVDFAAWAAVRSIGEAVTRTNAAGADNVRSYILSEDFTLDGFKGRPLTYRPWNGQLRHPIAITSPRAMLAMAPFEDFLHAGNELDTLGIDAPETTCTAFEE